MFLKQKATKILLYSVLINCLTLPLATYTYYYIINNLLIIEVLVILSESLLIMYLFEIRYKMALMISMVANLASALVGLIIIL